MTDSTGSITTLTQRIDAANRAINDEEKRHDDAMKGLRADRDLVEAEKAHALAGTSPEARNLATHVVNVKWHRNEHRNEFDSGVVAAAVSDIAAGAPILRTNYIGVKNYEGFHHQREDHKYGYGPRHGSIVFSVGLTDPVRKRLAEGGELTAEEQDAVIVYLTNLESAGEP